MTAGPSVQPGQLSPDGLWRWDGTQWVPVAAGGSPISPARRSKSWIWWLGGGCAVLLVLGVIGIGFGAYSIVNGIRNGAFNCLPGDFPSYPGATVSSERTYFGTGISQGDSRRCTIVLESNDGVAAVTSFYTQNLSSGDWTVTSSDPTSGDIRFKLAARPATVGDLVLLGHGQQTEIRIQLDS